MIYSLFGFPMSIGLKSRIAKKYFNRIWMSRCEKENKREFHKHLEYFTSIKVGDSVNTCTGLNGKIIQLYPLYFSVPGGELLADVDMMTSVGGCSFCHCGIAPPLTKAEMEARIQEYRTCSIADRWNWDIRYSPEVTTIHEDGSVTIDWEREKQLLAAKKQATTA